MTSLDDLWNAFDLYATDNDGLGLGEFFAPLYDRMLDEGMDLQAQCLAWTFVLNPIRILPVQSNPVAISCNCDHPEIDICDSVPLIVAKRLSRQWSLPESLYLRWYPTPSTAYKDLLRVWCELSDADRSELLAIVDRIKQTQTANP